MHASMHDLSVSIIRADGLVLLAARTSSGKVMAIFRFWICVSLAFDWLGFNLVQKYLFQ